ncbi:hypothetical protein CUJ83_14085 [Methanocella sp. CWC-04]|uniref:Uncharacterized protein n=1 Tax=Methanooceanicella nereidis TaxID=2052831 RepID=A0AAP2W779_9EURY|nr:hypothetical protein [Methanocella sp. CWC-04]MCD1296128.1 hypothetical protein [Methanocella sp. CWC-04]
MIECYRMVIEEPKLLLPSLLSVLVSTGISILLIVPVIIFNVMGKAGISILGFFIIAALFISYMVSYFFMGASSYAVYEHVKNGRSSMRNAFNRSASVASTLALLSLTGVILSFIVKLFKGSRMKRRNPGFNFIGGIFAGIVEEGWDVASRLLVPVAVISGLGYQNTIKKSIEIVGNNLVAIGVGEIGIRILTGMFGFAGVVLSLMAGAGIFLSLAGINFLVAAIAGIMVAFTGISLISTLNQFVKTSYYTLLYLWAVEGIEHGVAPEIAAKPVNISFEE